MSTSSSGGIGGTRNEQSGAENRLITARMSAILSPVSAASWAMVRGRRIARPARSRSVSARKIRSTVPARSSPQLSMIWSAWFDRMTPQPPSDAIPREGQAAAGRLLPAPEQSVLQHGQLVGIVAGVVLELLDQLRLDQIGPVFGLGFGELEDVGLEPPGMSQQWPDDRLGLLVAIEPGGQILVGAHGFGESAIAGTVAEEIRTHGEDDPDAGLGKRRCGEQHLDEPAELVVLSQSGNAGIAVAGLLRILGVGVPEQLLELIDQDQDFAIGRQQAPDFLGQTMARAAQAGGDPRVGLVPAPSDLEQRRGQSIDRMGAGSQRDDRPPWRAVRPLLLSQERQQTRLNERGLARAGTAEDRQESTAIEQAIEGRGVLVAAEEERVLLLAEGAKPGVRRAGLGHCNAATRRVNSSGVIVSAAGRCRLTSAERKLCL